MNRPLFEYLTEHRCDDIANAAVFSRLRWPAPTDPAVWADQVPVMAKHGTAALALRNVPGGAEFDDVRRDLRAHAMDDVLQTMVMTGRTAPLLAELQKRSIPFVVIKGPSAARFYEYHEDRPYTDIDIVVPGALFSTARTELQALGLAMEDAAAGPWPAFDRWCREGVNLFSADGAAVDLHHHVPPWRWGRRLTFERLRSQADTCTIAGIDVPVASAAHQLAISVLHLLSDSWHRTMPLLTLADVVNIALFASPHEIAAELRHLRVDWLCAEVLDSLPPGVIPTELRSQLRSRGPVRDRSMLKLVLPPSLPSRHPVGFGLRLPPVNMVAFGLGSLVPSPQYVEQRYGSRRAYPMWWSQAGRWGADAARGRDVGTPYSLDRLDSQ